MRNLRKLAQGRQCQIRVPGGCGNSETVVLCHYRMSRLSGAGLKSPDLFGAYGCYHCHAIVDGQIKSEFSREQRDLMLAEGVFRTQAILIYEGILKW
jgi:Protein of unknown function (DUF1364)